MNCNYPFDIIGLIKSGHLSLLKSTLLRQTQLKFNRKWLKRTFRVSSSLRSCFYWVFLTKPWFSRDLFHVIILLMNAHVVTWIVIDNYIALNRSTLITNIAQWLFAIKTFLSSDNARGLHHRLCLLEWGQFALLFFFHIRHPFSCSSPRLETGDTTF